jgi:peptidoglycan/xylan/chitin deacetylase (PgdA/CDA1 family)
MDFVHKLAAGTLPSDAVALTFDDGYVDNLTAGKPLLAAADVPATVFLATGYLDRSGEFWWDELARLILLEASPKNFDLTVRGDTFHFSLGMASPVSDETTPQAMPLTGRREVLTEIWQILRRLEDEERELILIELRSIFSVRGGHFGAGRAMTRDEVRRLVGDGLVTIGAHTVTHPVLSELGTAASDREISESKITCEALVEGPVAGFSYPYGDCSANARSVVVAAGFAFACSSRSMPAVATSDIFALPRISVKNWDGDGFESALCSASELT